MSRLATGGVRRRRSASLAAVLTSVVLVGLAACAPGVSGAFVSKSNSNVTITADATFKNYSQTVLTDNPWMYHRLEEAPTTAATSTSANSATTGPNAGQPGTYNGATGVGTVSGAATRWNMDEASGNSIADTSGNNVTGTRYGGVTWAGGRSGSAVKFPATAAVANYVEGTTATFNPRASFTMMTWVNLYDPIGDGTWPARQDILSINPPAAAKEFYAASIQYSKLTGKWTFMMSTARNMNGAGVHDSAASAVVPQTDFNKWVHVTGVFDSTVGAKGTMYIYVNGGGVQSYTKAGTLWGASCTDCKLNVGRMLDGGSYIDPMPGTMVDEVRVFPKALTPAEITTEMGMAPMLAGQTGALQGPIQGQPTTKGMQFTGSGNGYNNTLIASPGPTLFTIECWFKAPVGSPGGSIVGYSETQTGMSELSDRVVYMDNGGRIGFYIWDGAVGRTERTPLAYNDGEWHHLVASLGGAGMKIYVDGPRVKANSTAFTPRVAAGYWRWGGTDLNQSGLGNRPTSDYFVGTLDEIAVYNTTFSDIHINEKFWSNY